MKLVIDTFTCSTLAVNPKITNIRLIFVLIGWKHPSIRGVIKGEAVLVDLFNAHFFDPDT
jgi:hypothetical protein